MEHYQQHTPSEIEFFILVVNSCGALDVFEIQVKNRFQIVNFEKKSTKYFPRGFITRCVGSVGAKPHKPFFCKIELCFLPFVFSRFCTATSVTSFHNLYCSTFLFSSLILCSFLVTLALTLMFGPVNIQLDMPSLHICTSTKNLQKKQKGGTFLTIL